MKTRVILLGIVLITGCAAKKEDKLQQPVIHTGQCENSGKKINCTWNNVPAENTH